MSGGDGIGDFERYLERSWELKWAIHEQSLQRLAVEEFHGNKWLPVMFVNFINRADIRMIQSGRGAGLAFESFEHFAIAGSFLGKEFQRHEAAQARVFSLVNDAHPAAAQLLEDMVVRNRFPNK